MKKVLIVVVVLAVVAAVFFLKKSEKTQEKATPIEIAAKKIDGFEWSKLASEKMNLDAAAEYCENLKEGGYSDWRLPNIDKRGCKAGCRRYPSASVARPFLGQSP